MSLYLMRPQCLNKIKLNIGEEHNSPQALNFCDKEGGPSPGIDTEIIEEVPDNFDALLYDQGTDAGFVLVEEV